MVNSMSSMMRSINEIDAEVDDHCPGSPEFCVLKTAFLQPSIGNPISASWATTPSSIAGAAGAGAAAGSSGSVSSPARINHKAINSWFNNKLRH